MVSPMFQYTLKIFTRFERKKLLRKQREKLERRAREGNKDSTMTTTTATQTSFR